MPSPSDLRSRLKPARGAGMATPGVEPAPDGGVALPGVEIGGRVRAARTGGHTGDGGSVSCSTAAAGSTVDDDVREDEPCEDEAHGGEARAVVATGSGFGTGDVASRVAMVLRLPDRDATGSTPLPSAFFSRLSPLRGAGVTLLPREEVPTALPREADVAALPRDDVAAVPLRLPGGTVLLPLTSAPELARLLDDAAPPRFPGAA